MLAFDYAVVHRDRLALALAFDRASSRSFDQDGRLHVQSCRISKANVCPYFGREIPGFKELALDANKVYMLYRDPEELKKAASSFRNLQLLMIHAPVNAHDAKTHVTVGTVGSEISFDGTYLVADQLTVWTKEGIRLIETGEAQELSCSYRYSVDMKPGVDPTGVAFDGRMRDIMGNHVALVSEGRAGPDVVVSDALPSEISTMKLQRPNLLARIMSLGVLAAGTYDEEAKVALDGKIAAMTEKDCDPAMDEDMEDDPENPGKKRKKIAGTAGEPGTPRGANDAQIEAAIIAKGYISKADAEKLANDAATRASDEAVARVNALHVAREAVKPLVGVVAMDSAAAVYKFALEHEKVALDGVTGDAALAALVAQRVALKGAAPAASKTPALAADAASSVSAALPGLSRISVS